MGNKFWSEEIQQRGTKISEKQYKDLDCTNKIPYTQLLKAWERNGRLGRNLGYTCGLNALNMAKKMLGYTQQWDQISYPYNWAYHPKTWPLFLNPLYWFKDKPQELRFKWGLHSAQFGTKLITPNFTTSTWQASSTMPWDIISGTNFQKQVIIVLVQYGLSFHYILLIGVNDDKTSYITTDQCQRLHWISGRELESLMKVRFPGIERFCAYRVG